jgi:hypothetical protein
MYRLHLPPDAGMLFVLPADEPPAFWMRDTFIPLSLAFLDAEGTILSIVDLMPLDETMRVGPEAARYALEVNRGWFAERGIVPGARVELALDD